MKVVRAMLMALPFSGAGGSLVDQVHMKTNLWKATGEHPQRSSFCLPVVKEKEHKLQGMTMRDFDSRKEWPGCADYVRDQQQCGSCWAFGASETLSDRYCVQSGEKVLLSPQFLVDCDERDFGCEGGMLDRAWQFLEDTGIPEDQKYPYVAEEQVCPVKFQQPLYKCKKGTVQTLESPTEIMREIMKGGPVETGFNVYEDFMHYRGGIYHHVVGKLLGGHAVKIIGFGEEDGVKYWLCVNSWGTSWGEQGLFRIRFGESGIDSEVWTCDPESSQQKYQLQ